MSLTSEHITQLERRSVGQLTDLERLTDSEIVKVVLDTCVLLSVHTDVGLRRALIATWDPAETLFIVSTVVLAELATKTHRESYRNAGRADRTSQAAHELFNMVRARTPWPVRGAAPLTLLSLGPVEQLDVAFRRHSSRSFVTWERPNGNPVAVPAMADHQVMSMAVWLKDRGHTVSFATIDGDARTAARTLGVFDEAFESNRRHATSVRGLTA